MSDQTVTHETFPDREVDSQAEFDADLDYLKGLASAIFEHATPQDLLHIAAFDKDQA
jgi:hypothetical protein